MITYCDCDFVWPIWYTLPKPGIEVPYCSGCLKQKKMKKESCFDYQGEIKLYYDENDPKVKEALEYFKECIYSEASLKDMLKHVAWHIARHGHNSMVEGVGYVYIEGYTPYSPQPAPFSGITVDIDYNDIYIVT